VDVKKSMALADNRVAMEEDSRVESMVVNDAMVAVRREATEEVIRVDVKKSMALADNRVATVANNRMTMAPDASSNRAMAVQETTAMEEEVVMRT